MDAKDQPNLSDITSVAASETPQQKSVRTSKYAGVTFRSSRDKFQARIYKGNKEFNLGLFDVAADAALAYDVTHRLVKKIASSQIQGTEKKILESYEADKNEFPRSLEFGETAEGEGGSTEINKLNFSCQRDYMNDRVKEMNDNLSSGAKQYLNCPNVEEVRSLVRSVAIRVVKTMIGAIDGGTSNNRRRGKNKKKSMDGSITGNVPSKKKKKSTVESKASDQTTPTIVAPSYAANVAAYSQWNGLGMGFLNPSRTKTELPIVSSPFAPAGFLQRHNDILSSLGGARFQSNVDERFLYGPLATSTTNKAYDDARALCSNDFNSNFLYEANQVGPSAFFGMGLGYQNGVRGGDINHHGLHAMLETADNYRDNFSNMWDVASNSALGTGFGGGIWQHNMYGALPEDLKRMMLMMAMGQSQGVLGNVGNMMSGVNNPLGGVYSNGLSGQTNGNLDSEYPKSLGDVNDGINSHANDVQQGLLASQNLQCFPSSLLNMPLSNGGLNNAWNRSQFDSVRDQPGCREADGQSTWQVTQDGLSKVGYDGLASSEQPALVNSFCQVAGFLSSNVSDEGGGANPADDVTQFLAKLQENSMSSTSGDI